MAHDSLNIGVDLGVQDERVVFPVGPYDRASVQVVYVGTPGVAWPTGTVPVLTLEVSNDGETWFGIDEAFIDEDPVTFSANGLAAGFNVTSVQYLSARVSTKGAATGQRARVVFYGRSSAAG